MYPFSCKLRRFRLRAWSAALASVLLVLAATVLWPVEDPEPLLRKTPPDSGPRANLPSYRGPHPASSARPAESFAFPIALGAVGPVDSLFAGPRRYPFLCQTEDSRLGQPRVDNQAGIGVAVYAEDGDGERLDTVVGYSKDCSLATHIRYFYNRVDSDGFYPLDEADGDIARIVIQGREIDFVVRVEAGTINRHIYQIATLAGPHDRPGQADLRHWNQRLIYQFRGGVGVGHRQGRSDPRDLLERRREQLQQGYAVAYSTANQTSTHYNLLLAEDTARRVKRQFETRYGKPRYTVGIGGSGGAIQQYILAQNAPGLLDAAIPLYAYPDMITQTIYAFDCELLEHYFDLTAADNPKWRHWSNRQWIEGLSAGPAPASLRQVAFDLARLVRGTRPQLFSGSSECASGWRGLTPLTHNPRYLSFAPHLAPEVRSAHHWSHWEDLRHIYGTDSRGYARSSWDNVGVQYGLEALVKGNISPGEFLHLNRHIGGWKPFEQMRQERFWRWGGDPSFWRFSPWSDHNITRAESPDGPAPRSEGDPRAIEAAFRAGLVFLGRLDIPVIDLRHYLEEERDMHHAGASFSTRRRLQLEGDSANQLIWIAHPDHNPVAEAFALIERWMERLRVPDSPGVAAARPADATDRCYGAAGEIIAQGEGVWDGAWNGRAVGPCLQRYPIFSDSRQVAGADLAGITFKCTLQPVEQALAADLYGTVAMAPHRRALEEIFPDGVCDYRQPSPWRTAALLRPPGEENRAFSLNEEPLNESPLHEGSTTRVARTDTRDDERKGS